MKNVIVLVLLYIVVYSCGTTRHPLYNINDLNDKSLNVISTLTIKDFIYASREECEIYIKSERIKLMNNFKKMERLYSDSTYSFQLNIGDRKFYKTIKKDTIYIKKNGRIEIFVFEVD